MLPLLYSVYGYASTATTTSISVSSASVPAGTAITLTATVLAGATHVHPGSVVFCNASATRCADSAIIGKAQLTSSGTAAITITPGLGSHSYAAIFNGTTSYTTSTSSSVSTTVTGYYPTTTVLTTSGSAGAYTLAATTTSTYNLPTYPYGTMDFEDASNGNYLFGTGSVGSGSTVLAFSLIGTNGTSGSPRRSAAADFNGDGRPDVVVTSQSGGNVAVFLGDGDGTFTAASGSPITTGSQPVAVATGDFNGDGYADIAVANLGGNSVSVFLGNGNGTFQTPTTLTGFNAPSAITVADFNNDGNLDLAFTSQTSNLVYVYLGNGAGGFTLNGSSSTGAGPYSVVSADFNGDGNLDLALGNNGASSVTVLLGDGTGNFTAASGSPVAVATNPYELVAVDLNNDGKVDLVTADSGDAYLTNLIGNGDGTFANYGNYSLASGQKEIAAGDFDGDGDMDIAVCNNSSNTLNVARGGGTGYFYAGASQSLGASGCSGLVIADFNGDGLPDVEASLQGNNTSTVLIAQVQHSASASFGPGAIPGNGSHNIFAYYPQDVANAASSSATVSLTATQSTTTLTLSAAPTSSTYSQQVALSATLSPYVMGSESTAAETITFYNGGSSIGTANLATGVALLNVTSLPVGTDSLTASYPGDPNFSASASSAVSYTVTSGTASISGTTVTYTAYTSPTTSVGTTSATQTAMVNIATAGTLSTVSVLTQGISGLDYAPVSGGTCATGTAYTAGQVCTVQYTFTPTSPGQRLGAVSLTTSTGQLLGVSYLAGIGLGPLLALTPAVIATVAGNGASGYSGDGAAATSAQIGSPYRASNDTVGNLYMADSNNHVVRKVTASTGVITTVAGTGTAGFSGDGGSATSAQLGTPNGVGVDALGNIYISDISYCRIRKVTVATGIITTVVGNGTCGFSGDNGPATSAAINSQLGDIAFDGAGNFYFTDQYNARVREVNISTGVITTLAGTGTAGFSGDGGPATSAMLNNPNCVALDVAGNLYITDESNNRIREVNASTGAITTVAGNGSASFSGDGGAATSAALNQPYGATVDAAGNIYIADSHNNRVRMVSAATGNISTIAGNGSAGFSGDGSAATLATLNTTADVSLDGAGNLLIADVNNHRMRLVTIASAPSIAFSNTAVGASSAANNETVSNIGTAALTVASISVPANFSLGGASTTCTTGSQTLASAANCVLGIEFAPTGAGPLSGNIKLTDNSLNVAGTTQTISLSGTAIQGTPTVTWGTPAAITYGTALSGTQLNATASVPGTFVYSPAAGTVLNAGAGQTLSVAFTPTDTSSYNNASDTTTITVNQASSPIALATSTASSGYGSAVAFTATLPAGASGTVTFLDGGSSIGTGTISGATATFSIATLSVGSHTITASWPGNSNYLASTSASLAQTIVKSAAALSEVSSLNPSLYGDTVVLSISTTGSGPTPTGTVTLTDSGTTLTTLTLSASGTVSYSTSLLSAGNHSLKVTYNGDANYF